MGDDVLLLPSSSSSPSHPPPARSLHLLAVETGGAGVLVSGAGAGEPSPHPLSFSAHHPPRSGSSASISSSSSSGISVSAASSSPSAGHSAAAGERRPSAAAAASTLSLDPSPRVARSRSDLSYQPPALALTPGGAPAAQSGGRGRTGTSPAAAPVNGTAFNWTTTASATTTVTTTTDDAADAGALVRRASQHAHPPRRSVSVATQTPSPPPSSPPLAAAAAAAATTGGASRDVGALSQPLSQTLLATSHHAPSTPATSSANNPPLQPLAPIEIWGRTPDGRYTRDQVAQHNSRESCWLVVRGVVYDVTDFLKFHPAGANAILRHAGQDATVDFDFHDGHSQKLWKKYIIGKLVASEQPSSCLIS
ncbi:hypothetical protein CAOG_05367 [Capsaspora owczarzaki ATCC 30864]|uniref:Cytochrome b5 heme-binding domain-containing protein n=1 Tax=Capsaspora owczarzaki (strain ATCC 30864) TaxID=595528 RepID=A0A0D2WRW4_CAPO3|nr:hypothetical protein CAOG_05367 [Capsaspora owczarzaki ATCC 30864]KJE94785.1 hypothetical protein CAOG_005367 [Capsaspora owczarzaki ATCC 30864]|eukprot:XP_004347052.1 hypothetical protein CAOG_05367 [Capsaspora owczarzaki ATCC 30864]